MTLEQLRIFVAVAEREHVTRAAEALDLTQSAASGAIAALEREFATKLFHRVGRGIALTEAGHVFLTEARAILGRADAATAAMREVSGLARGHLAIKASQTIANHFLPLRLVAFRNAYPGISLAVSIGNSADVTHAIIEGGAELGFVESPGDTLAHPQIAAEPIAQDRLVMVVAADHPWAHRTDLTTADLAAGTWVLREDGSGTRAVFIEAMAALGVAYTALDIAIELPANGSVLTAVIGGAGATILSELVCADAIAAGKLAELPITLPRRTYFAVQHQDRTRTRAAAALLAMLRRADPE
ncbi:MAG: LysR family transcriptional regulator [Acidiphilium sp.]|nr:LysR family transcriptional regulator [Acidiphilium sp.]MDD4936254.1 LysR family transcriptional regulator [Acidiphilium sp.]